MDKEIKLVADFWSRTDCSASEKNFYCFPPIRVRSCKSVFGEADSRPDWCEYWTVEKYLKDRMPFSEALSLCCGFGEVERFMERFKVATSITGLDISPGAIEEAKKRAADEGLTTIEYRVCDINKEELPRGKYDLVWANGALHHLRDLERVVERIHDSIKPGGMLVSNEYVGPRYQQVGERQQEIINAVVHLLPAMFREEPPASRSRKLRQRLFSADKQSHLGQVWRPTPLSYFVDTDPSECVRSDLIIPTLRKVFSRVEVKQFGGSILFYALGANFYDRFDMENKHHRMFLEMLFNIEDTMIETGELTPDNAHIICWKEGPLPR